MSHRILQSAVVLLVIILSPAWLRADAAGDLAAGRTALEGGDADKALGLLTAAAQALPNSVEAQLALAECHAKLGQMDLALVRYRAVLKLSPEHAQAKRIVTALTGQKLSWEERLASVRTLLEVAAYPQAEALLLRAVEEPVDPAQRAQARLLLAETRLWANSSQLALADALRVLQESQDAAISGPARVIAALALLNQPEVATEKAGELITQAGELAAPWSARASLATSLIALDDPTQASRISAALAKPVAGVPAGAYRQAVLDRLTRTLFAAARAQLAQGDLAEALAIVVPMIRGQGLPAADAVLKPVNLAGGWLDGLSNTDRRVQASRILAEIGKAEFDRGGAKASLLGYWLAAEVQRQLPRSQPQPESHLAQELAGLSRTDPSRKLGSPLGVADEVQRAVLLEMATRTVNEEQRKLLVELIVGQIVRYQQAGDLETGLAKFVTVTPPAAAKPVMVELSGALNRLPPGAAHLRLYRFLADRYAELGHKAFKEQVARLAADATLSVQLFDAVALTLEGQVAAFYPGDKASRAGADAIFERYASLSQWTAAREAAAMYYAPQSGDAGRWAVVRLKIRQAIAAEDRLLAADRQLGKQLPPLVQEALTETLQILGAAPSKSTRQAGLQIAGTLIGRYAGLERLDLAEAVIAATADVPAGAALADWALWVRAGLLDSQADRALALAVARASGDAKLPLHDLHKAELALLSQLLTKHPQSEFLPLAVERVVEIAMTYQNHQSFDMAQAVLADFLKLHPKLAAAERLEFIIVHVQLAKARLAFSKRDDKAKAAAKPPEKLIPEHVAAIDALAAFLKAHPTGDYSPAAENELFEIARAYGQAGAWPLVREVLDRLSASVVDFRRPGHLRLWHAATYLGELDGAYGLSLLNAAAKPKSGTFSATALAALGDLKEGDELVPGLDVSGTFATSTKTDTAKESGARPPKLPIAKPIVPGFDLPPGESKPNDTALALVRQSQQRQFQKIAMLENEKLGAGKGEGKGEAKGAGGGAKGIEGLAVALRSGSVLSEAEMKRQEEAADKAYAILIALVKNTAPADAPIAAEARGHILWLFGFFEGQSRADRAIVLIKRYLTDQPNDPAQVALAYQSITDQLAWAAQPQHGDRIDQVWADRRHELFEQARKEIEAFIAAQMSNTQMSNTPWVNQARLLTVVSYEQEAQLVSTISAVRAGGLLVRSAEAVISLVRTAADHPEAAGFAGRLWSIADQLSGLGQDDQSIYVLSQIPIYFPTDPLSLQSVLRIAELYSRNLSNPLLAVETYQEYLSLGGDHETVLTHVLAVAQQLAAKQRYLEALHVYGVFVDTFPADPRAADALKAIGQTHQANEAWEEAIKSYQRILEEYPGVPVIPQVKLAMAECEINLGQWRSARGRYEEYLAQHPKDGQVQIAQARIPVLKSLERYQNLLADPAVVRNKDDAQFQIGRIVLEQLGNPVKALAEFGKVVSNYPKSDLADDAQIEIGKALLSLNRLDEARAGLLQVARLYPNSPVADDALYLIGQSYEQQAHRLTAVTAEKARSESFEQGQRGAYQSFNRQQAVQDRVVAQRRDMLKKAGKDTELALDEAANASRLNSVQVGNIFSSSRHAELCAETESALQIANRQDRINDAYRQAVAMYIKAASDYPLGDKTDESLLRIAQIFETELKDRPAAMQTYQKIVKLFPGTPVAEDAAWKVALFYEQEGKYAAAGTTYRDLIRNYPASPRVADAQFAMAEVLEQLGQWVEAMDAYETFRQKFGNHPKTQLAVEQINWIKAYRK